MTDPRPLTVIVQRPCPKISIVTPSFNQGEFLEECIDSILSQGYPNLEYIIMDGGSSDISVLIIKRYEKYLTYWQSQLDGGHYIALNTGFSRTTGEIMAWLNSDDKYHPDAFLKVLTALESGETIEWVTGKATTWNRAGRLEMVAEGVPHWSRQYLIEKTFAKRWFIQQESTFWKRSLWNKVGGKLSENLKLAADFELWLRFSRHAQLFVVDDLIGGFRSYDEQRSKLFFDQYMNEVELAINQEIEQTSYVSQAHHIPAPQPITFTNHEIIETRQRLGLIDEIVLVTSIAPKGFEKQSAAIDSWISLGFKVISLNNYEEVQQLQPLYEGIKGIEFHTVSRDARQEAGRPLVYVDDVFQYLRENGTDICGIINSDIQLKADRNFMSFVLDHAKESMVFGSRVDIDAQEHLDGEVFIHGFDVFFLNKDFLNLFPPSKFCLGLPWWDYFVPCMMLQQGVQLKYLSPTVAYHVKHPANYSDELWKKMGIHFTEFFLPKLSLSFQEMLDNEPDELKSKLSRICIQFIKTLERTCNPIRYGTPYDQQAILKFLHSTESKLQQVQNEKEWFNNQYKAWKKTAQQLQEELEETTKLVPESLVK
ncbi:MAG: glycosyltransferase family 2 protein [Microcoleaceae cyanobacterium]